MRTHEEIDRRSLDLARAIAARIDADPRREGLVRARATCERWMATGPSAAAAEWMRILANPWERVRVVLLRADEDGRRLRQNSPFCGILTPRERWDFYRRWGHESPTA